MAEKMEMDMEMEEEDPVVKELDVFVSSQLAKHLYLLQYPLRPKKRPYQTQDSQVHARIKPKSQKLEVNIPSDITSQSYNTQKGEELANAALSLSQNGNDNESLPPNLIQGGLLSSQLMVSSQVPQKTHYTVGVLRDDQLHLTFVNSVLQLRPSFKFFDELANKRKEIDEPEEKEEEEEEEEVKAVQVQLKRGESSKSQEAKKKTHSYQQQQIDEEPWVNLEYYDKNSVEANTVFEKLFAASHDPIEFDQNPSKFLSLVAPKPPTLDHHPVGDSAGVITIRDLKNMTLEEQIKTLLINTSALHFDRIKELVSSRDVPKILEVLDSVAVLIQGCWVIKSEFKFSGRAGLCRDYLLGIFLKDRYVSRKEFSDIALLTSDTVRDILSEISTLRTGKRWEFKLPTDTKFMKAYPQIVEKQTKQIEEQFPRIMRALGIVNKEKEPQREKGKEKEKELPKEKEKEREKEPLKEEEKGKRTKEEERDNKIKKEGNPFDQQLSNLVQQLFILNGVCNFEYIQKQVLLHQMDTTKENNLLANGVSEEKLKETIDNLALKVRDVYVLKSVNPTTDEYRNVIIELFKQSKSVKKSDIMSATLKQLNKQLPNTVYHKVTKELAISTNNQWVLKSGDGIER